MLTIIEDYLKTVLCLAAIAAATVTTVYVVIVLLKADLVALLLHRLASPS
jgi:hypothetical protein